MAKNKTFDLVTIVGIVAAVGIFFGGQLYLQKRQAEVRTERALEAEREAALLRPQQAARPPQPAATTVQRTPPVMTAAQGEQGTPLPPPSAAETTADEPEPVAQEITVETPTLKLIFSTKGAALQQAFVADAYVDPALKDKKGLEIVRELAPGWRTLGLPNFDIGPPEMDRQNERKIYAAFHGPLKALGERVWKLEADSEGFNAQGKRTLTYSVSVAQQFTVTKTFTLSQDSRAIGVDLRVTNLSTQPVNFTYWLCGPAGLVWDGPPADPHDSYAKVLAELAGRDSSAAGQTPSVPDVKQIYAAAAATGDLDATSISRPENLWAVVKARFYLGALIARDPTELIRLRAFAVQPDLNNESIRTDKRFSEPTIGVLGVRRSSPAVEPGKSSEADSYALYLGPADEAPLTATEEQLHLAQPLHLNEAIQYCDMFGWRWPRVDLLARGFMWLFKQLYWLFGSYGMAVVLLTLVIKGVLHPLQRKMMVSMNKMQKLQPELKKIQEKYKNAKGAEKQKMMLEQQDLMKKSGASAGGCLPMFIQIPVFTALYGIFNRAFEIRGAQFLWINDLSQQDHLATLPFFPRELNLLPLLYMGVTLLQTRLTPQPPSTDEKQEMQRKMGMYMPIMFSFLFYRMPAGLVLYFAASAIFGMGETWYIRKFLIKQDEAVPVVPAAKKK